MKFLTRTSSMASFLLLLAAFSSSQAQANTEVQAISADSIVDRIAAIRQVLNGAEQHISTIAPADRSSEVADLLAQWLDWNDSSSSESGDWSDWNDGSWTDTSDWSDWNDAGAWTDWNDSPSTDRTEDEDDSPNPTDLWTDWNDEYSPYPWHY